LIEAASAGMLAAMASPILFVPQYMERVWGGRTLETRYGRELPEPGVPFGESWEISDRPEACSVVTGGPHDGRTLHDLWDTQREEIFGPGFAGHGRFPLLVKILDARDDLSIQVHPPLAVAAALGGEPKTEMWFIAKADPGAKLFVGLKPGVTRERFATAIASGEVADLVHAIEPHAGDSIFIPSGRLHAIGAGLVIFEIQQNSDTTYRVFDWNRVGLDGAPRDLHVAESLECIDFSDTAPAMDAPVGNTLASCEHFKVQRQPAAAGTLVETADRAHFSIVAVVSGSLMDDSGRCHGPGSFILLPRNAAPLQVIEAATLLHVSLPHA
jgi:mannose-6-phosphate isomerase